MFLKFNPQSDWIPMQLKPLCATFSATFSATCAAATAALLLTACDAGTAPPDAATVSAAWRLDAAPEGAVGVAAAKAEASAGERVVVTGKVGGRLEPVSPEAGLFVIMDPAVPSCADLHEDGCATPWDYCCEPRESVVANAATVMLQDGAGAPVRLAAGDLTPLSQVTVTGTVADRPSPEVLIIQADGVHVH